MLKHSQWAAGRARRRPEFALTLWIAGRRLPRRVQWMGGHGPELASSSPLARRRDRPAECNAVDGPPRVLEQSTPSTRGSLVDQEGVMLVHRIVWPLVTLALAGVAPPVASAEGVTAAVPAGVE